MQKFVVIDREIQYWGWKPYLWSPSSPNIYEPIESASATYRTRREAIYRAIRLGHAKSKQDVERQMKQARRLGWSRAWI